MYPLFETIRIEGGTPRHLGYHIARMNRSRRELFGATGDLDLAAAIRVPDGAGAGLLRCRVTYGESIGEVTFAPYEPRAVRSIALADGGRLDYAHKYADRSGIENLLAAGVREGADDILIVRGGLVTDTSAANIACFDGTRWVTPSTPLLPGTTRARLLDLGLVVAREIRVAGLADFGAFALMNAMIEFDTANPIPVSAIRGA
jgi:4-amino-4-deoxychorismate lyase